MRFIFIFFLLLMLSILAASHIFVYATLVRFFAVDSVANRKIIASLVIFFGLSFFLSSLIIHWWENIISRSYYFVAGSWLGFITVFIALSIFGWLILGLSERTGLVINEKIIGVVIVVLSVFISAYGIYSAGRPEVNELRIKIDNLPAGWQGKTIVQISDVHLGAIHRPDFIEKITAKINQLKPEAVFITGDYYDGMDGQLEELAKPLDDLEAPKGIYFVTGNHETYLGLDLVFAALNKTKIKILNDEKVTLDGLTVTGVSYAPFNETKRVAETVKKIAPEKPSILLYHEPRQIESIAETNLVDLMLSGHTHNGQIWPIKYISRLIYKKYTNGLQQIGKMSVYTSSGVGTWGPPMRTAAQPEIVAITLE